MRDVWCWLGTVLLIVAGCRTAPPNLKPDKQPEQYALPPDNDPRYNKPPTYPKDPDDPSAAPRKWDGTGGAGGVGPTHSPRGGMGTPGTPGTPGMF